MTTRRKLKPSDVDASATDVPLPATDNVMRAIALIEWARMRRVRISGVLQVGDVVMTVDDPQVMGPAGPADLGVYGEAGLTGEPADGTGG